MLQSFHGDKPKRGKILCPFHDEKTPSFHVYEDGFKCYGCQEYGDNIAFVSKLEAVAPLEAARMIAARFGLPVDQSPFYTEDTRINELRRKRNITKLYRELEKKAFLNIANLKSLVLGILEICGLDIEPETVKAVHMLPEIEHNMMILATGSYSERLKLLRKGVITKWAKLS